MNALEISTELTRAVLGLDAFYRSARGGSSDHLDNEGLVPVHWSALEPLETRSYDEALQRFQDIARRASELPDPYERDWLTEQAFALNNLTRWVSGAHTDYELAVAGTQRVDPGPPSPRVIHAAKAASDKALRAAGYPSFAAYRADNLIPASELEENMRALIAELRRRTERELPHLELPKDIIGTKVVSGVAFSGYCDYPGRQVWLNSDVPFTYAELKQVMAHEAYPGHDAHMGHRDALVRSGRALPDTALVITNTASSVLFEGIAERGLDLLGWRDEEHDAIAWLHNRLQWLCSIEVAHGVNTGRLTKKEAATFLKETCDGDDAWIDAKLRFVTHRLRATFVYSYWWGGTVVGRWWDRVPALRTKAAVRHLYDKMHSPSTLEAHWTAEGAEYALR